ncbi:MAG: hypothetical protein IJW23_13805 [Lentisphaeria bacterium]|nr:hypothetical protein [Lentisphaeria bacterium]
MKKIFRAGAFALMMFAALTAFAQDGDSGNRRNGGDRPGNRRNGGDRPGFRSREQGRRGFGWGARQNPRAAAEKKLKAQFPNEFAEIERLRAEAEKKLQALAKKANIELPAPPKSMEERMADLKKKYPKEMKEIEDLQRTDPRAAFTKLRALMMKENGGKAPREGGPAMRENSQKLLRAAQKKYPAEWKEIQKIRRKNPAKARKMTKDLIEKYKRESKK